MTRLALAAKCGRPGRPPVAGDVVDTGVVTSVPARTPSPSSSEPRATAPRPIPERARKSRRLTCCAIFRFVHTFASSFVIGKTGSLNDLFLCDRFVQVEDDAGGRRVGRQLDGSSLGVERALAVADQLQSRLPVGVVRGAVALEPAAQDGQLGGRRRSGRSLVGTRRRSARRPCSRLRSIMSWASPRAAST